MRVAMAVRTKMLAAQIIAGVARTRTEILSPNNHRDGLFNGAAEVSLKRQRFC